MKQKGFTLIELMIVVAIIGILAAIAIPQYNKYVARTQVAEAFALMAPVKTALILHHQETGEFPTGTHVETHLALGLASRGDLGGDYVRRIAAKANGSIRVLFFNTAPVNDLIKDKMFELRPTISSGVITSWECFTNVGSSAWIDEEYIKSCD